MKENKNLLIYLFPAIFISIFFCGLTIIAPHLNFYNYVLPIAFFVLIILNILIYFQLIKGEMTDKIPEIKPQVVDKNISPELNDKIKYEAILAYIGEGLVVINKAGKIITFNKAAESLLGWTEKEVLGRELTEIIRIDYETSISESRLTSSRQSSLYFIRKDDTKFPAAITTTSYGVGSDILGTATLFRDITMEQNVDKMKNEFISLASHQLRTPLAAIKWYTEMLLKGDAGNLLPEQAKYADTIYSSTQRMIDLVNLLLNISRIESGRINVEPLPTDLKKLVDEVVQEVKIRYADKKHTYTLKFADALPMITIDPRLIRQVYVNLLTNAAKYTPENGQIKVELTKGNTDIVSEISDNGYGIPDQDQEKLFGKFFRGLKTVTRENGGTGLGLYLVKDIIDVSHGKIWFKSKEGKGTTFWVSLPLSGTPPKKGMLTLET
jgi:PAS domain S-box-containing protein